MCLLKEGSEEKRLRFERVASVWVCCFLRVTAKKKVCDYWNGEVPRGKESEKIEKKWNSRRKNRESDLDQSSRF